MLKPDPERLLAFEVAARDGTDYRFRWGTYIGWTILTFGLYTHYGTYRLVQRRAEHGVRRREFSAALWHVLAVRAEQADRTAEAQPGLDNLSRVHSALEEYERANKRNAALLMILRVVAGTGLGSVFNFAASWSDDPHPAVVAVGAAAGLVSAAVGAYINHVLNKDLRFLETWEDAMFQQASWVLGAIGMPVGVAPRRHRIPRRDTALYVFLTVISLGLFAIWWRYAMMQDGNRHFDDDGVAEDGLLWALGIRAGVPGPPLPPRD